jgi:hypothetical protein
MEMFRTFQAKRERLPSPPPLGGRGDGKAGLDLKHALAAAALFCLCATALAAPENPSSVPAERLYSVAEFNRLGAGVYWVKAYIAALYYPQCKPDSRCPPFYALISDAPGDRVCANEKICFLANILPAGQKIYRLQHMKAAPGKADSGDAFRVLENWLGLELPDGGHDAPRIRLRIRVQDDPEKFAILEDFCAGADCEKAQGKGN